MQIILLQTAFSEENMKKLIEEFPQYLFLKVSEKTLKNLGVEEWKKVEIFCGTELSPKQLAQAPNLHWIHTPTPHLHTLCLDAIEKRGNILVTYTKQEHFSQVAEYVLATTLSFGKNLFKWAEAKRQPGTIWESPLREETWSMEGGLFLQIGLEEQGTAIAKKAQAIGMKVWGVHEQHTFHPNCQKVFTFQELHTILPIAEIISITPSKTSPFVFGAKELRLLQNSAILVLLGDRTHFDENALIARMEGENPLKGVVFDLNPQSPLPSTSKLWSLPNTLITPNIATPLEKGQALGFRHFCYNLRQFLHGNFREMRTLAGTKRIVTT